MKRIAALGLLCALFVQGFAGQSRIMFTPRAMLAAMPEVKKELKLTKEQDKQILEAMKSHAKDMESGSASFDMSNPMGAFDEAIRPILDDAQKARLQELLIQYNGGFALTDKAVGEALALTDDEKAKIKDLDDQCRQETLSKMQTAHSNAALKAVTKMREGYGEKMVAVLTPDQAKKFADMQGKKFKFRT